MRTCPSSRRGLFFAICLGLWLGMGISPSPSYAGTQATLDNPTGSNENAAPPRSTSLGDSIGGGGGGGERGIFVRAEFGIAMNSSSGSNSGLGLTLMGQDGFGLAGAIGYQFNDNISAGILAEWRPKYYNSYNYSSLAFIPEIAYAFPYGNARPYVGLGIGMAINSTATPSHFTFDGPGYTGGTWDNVYNFALAWTAGLGVDFAINDRIAVRLGYRYLNLGSFSSDAELTLRRSDGSQVKVPNDLGLARPTVNEIVLGVGFMF
ncbi:MAG: outer membrane beta-barrel protein [Candidatus Symbiobacter sp.]|nr:outer membrane beta-barrel protein [Candidatus Symbiobacter sp.]